MISRLDRWLVKLFDNDTFRFWAFILGCLLLGGIVSVVSAIALM